MRKSLKQLSPKARKLLLKAAPNDRVLGTIIVNANTLQDPFKAELEKLDIHAKSWNSATHQIQVELPVSSIEAMASLPDVVYFEAAARYSI